MKSHYNGISFEEPENLKVYLHLFVLLYADDTIIVAESASELQKALDGLGEYCKKWGLEINENKSKVVVFSRGKIRKKPSLTLGETHLEVQDSYIYLGIKLNYNGSFSNAITKQIQQAKRAMYSLLAKTRKLHLPIDITCHLFNTCITPILLYGCEVWGYNDLKKVEAVQLMFSKQILRLNNSTASCIVLGELGLAKLETIVHQRMLNYWARLQAGKQSKLSKLAYDLLLAHHTANHFKSKWVGKIEHLLNNLGMSNIWLSGRALDPDSFSGMIQRRLTDIHWQNWHSEVDASGHCVNYRIFKESPTAEAYLTKVPRRKAISLCRFRAGNSKIPAVTGRYTGTDRNERLCHLCQMREVGDEYHYILSCPFFTDARAKLIKKYYWTSPNTLKLTHLFTSPKVNELSNLARFIDIVNEAL